MPELLLVWAILSALFVANAARPSRNQLAMALSFFPAWLVSELPVHVFVFQAIGAAALAAAGGLEEPYGLAALPVLGVAWWLLWRVHRVAERAPELVSLALLEALGDDYEELIADSLALPGDRTARQRRMRPFHFRDERVRMTRDIEFANYGRTRLRLDIVHPADRRRHSPVLLVVHGGAWVIGFKERQMLPLMTHMAARGWVCVNIDYRLSPKATFPDHLVDVKRAIAWIHEHVAEFGGDPRFLAVTGNSAGGHLTALAGLTANDREYQPGFEGVDTSVQAAVPLYGIYDFTNRHGTMPKRWVKQFIGRIVLKKDPDEDPEAFRRASPLDRVHAGAPAFFVVHGTLDNLAPAADARAFVDALGAVSRNEVHHLEIPGAGHAFDTFHSTRSAAAVDAVARWLAHRHAVWLRQQDDERSAAGSTPTPA